MPSVSAVGRNSSCFCASSLFGTTWSMVMVPRSTTPRLSGQGLVGSLVFAGCGQLRFQVEADRTALQTLRQFRGQEVRRALGGIGGVQVVAEVLVGGAAQQPDH